MRKTKMRKRDHAARRQLARLINADINAQRSTTLAEIDDMAYRSATIGDMNEEARTVTATISTEQPVPMYDYRTGRMIDEVLLARGGKFPNQIPLLDNHSRWGSDSVLGSGRNIRQEGDRWRASLHFAKDAGDQPERTWQLVRQGHLTDVSIGYRYEANAFVEIAPGKTETVQGRQFTANPNRTLRVVTDWIGKEVSTTPIGADDQAKIGRSNHHQMAERCIPGEETYHSSSQDSASNGRTNRNEEEMSTEAVAAPVTETRSESAPVATTSAPVAPAVPSQTAEQIRAERERVAYIYQQRGTLGDDIVERAITESWDTNKINLEFSSARKNAAPENQRSQPLSGHAPAGHVVDRTVDVRTLQAAMLQRSRISIEHPLLRSEEAQFALSTRDAGGQWLINHARNVESGGPTRDEAAARAVDKAWLMRNMSMIDICRAALDCEGINYDRYDQHDIMTRSFSTATLNAIFTTNFSAQLLDGFMGVADTTVGWTASSELPNFLTAERIQGHKFSRLRKVDRNQAIGDANVQAVYESYKLARYAEKFTVDEMDIIDDRFGMINMAPQDMGEAARELRPDLVYSILLNNPTMSQDSTALFATGHSNYTSSGAALSSSTLAARRAAMKTQTSNGRLINIQGQYLIVPETKWHTASVLVSSAERRDTTSSTEYVTKNWAQNQFTVVSEGRLDAGLVDPTTDTAVAGQAGTWFLAAANGKYGIEVGTLRGTGGIPVIRRYTLGDGLLGVGWMVIMYVAAKAVGYQGLACSKA